MSKRSMIITAPDKIKNIDDKNPENKKVQSVQEPGFSDSDVQPNKADIKQN